MRKEKKGFNWVKYENGRDNEIRKLAELLKSVIWRLDDPYSSSVHSSFSIFWDTASPSTSIVPSQHFI